VIEISYLRKSRKRAIFRMRRSSGARKLRWHPAVAVAGAKFGPAVVNVRVTAFDKTLRELKKQQKQPLAINEGNTRRDERQNEIGPRWYSDFNPHHLWGSNAEEHREPRGERGGRSRTEAA
jgi:hypothetical protein